MINLIKIWQLFLTQSYFFGTSNTKKFYEKSGFLGHDLQQLFLFVIIVTNTPNIFVVSVTTDTRYKISNGGKK